jgi:putative ABC transport system permease protein
VHAWRVAVRSVVRRRGLALAIVLTLTLGIGANAAIFSAIDAVLLRPLPYPASDRLAALYEANASRRQATGLVAPVRLEDWNRENRSFEGLAGSYFENLTDTTGPLPERVVAMRTSPRFFGVLGTPAALGRTPSPEEERFGGPMIAVLSDGFWRTRFDADPSIVGRVLVLGDQRRTVIGVMPASFRYPQANTEMWIPAQLAPAFFTEVFGREARFFTAVGRLKPGVTLEAARDDLAAVQTRLGRQFPRSDQDWSASVVSLKEEQVGGVRRSLWLLFGAVLLVLAAACGNIACLLLADATRREHEMAVRFAIGASRRVVIRQLLLEGLVLAIAGSLLGLFVARFGIQALRAAATRLPRATELTLDWRIVAFTLMLGVLTTVLFALAPALRATRRDVAERLAHGGRTQAGTQHLLQRVLVAAQVTLAIVLLVGAGLLLRSFVRLQQVSPGFDPDHVLAFRMSATWSERGEAVANRQLRTLQRLEAMPGVTDVAISNVLPAGSDWPPSEITIVGRETGEHYFTVIRQVSAGYFKTLRIPILQGATCHDEAQTNARPQVLVNRTFAERFFPNENPLLHEIAQQRFRAEIVGIVGDVHERGLARDAEPTIYNCGLMPFWPDPFHIVRIDSTRAPTAAALRDALHEVEPRRSVYGITTLTETLSESISEPRLNTILLTMFAATTLLLASIGLHGMLAQFVSQRRREIGLRIALGAQPADVLAQVLWHGAMVVAAGIAAGLAGAFVLARFMSTLVFGISPRDPITFAFVPLVLALIAAIATLVPARRAVRVDPMDALRE